MAGLEIVKSVGIAKADWATLYSHVFEVNKGGKRYEKEDNRRGK